MGYLPNQLSYWGNLSTVLNTGALYKYIYTCLYTIVTFHWETTWLEPFPTTLAEESSHHPYRSSEDICPDMSGINNATKTDIGFSYNTIQTWISLINQTPYQSQVFVFPLMPSFFSSSHLSTRWNSHWHARRQSRRCVIRGMQSDDVDGRERVFMCRQETWWAVVSATPTPPHTLHSLAASAREEGTINNTSVCSLSATPYQELTASWHHGGHLYRLNSMSTSFTSP